MKNNIRRHLLSFRKICNIVSDLCRFLSLPQISDSYHLNHTKFSVDRIPVEENGYGGRGPDISLYNRPSYRHFSKGKGGDTTL